MADLNIVQSAWTNGQVSTKVNARDDTTIPSKSAALIQNFSIMQQGGLTKRPGTFFRQALDSNMPTRLIPFKNQYGDFILVLESLRISIYALEADSVKLVSYDKAYIWDSLKIYSVDIYEINWAQDDNAIVLVHRNMPPIRFIMSDYTSNTTTAEIEIDQLCDSKVPEQTTKFLYLPTEDYGNFKYTDENGNPLWFVIKSDNGKLEEGDTVTIGIYKDKASAKADDGHTNAKGMDIDIAKKYINGTVSMLSLTVHIDNYIESGKPGEYFLTGTLLYNELIKVPADGSVTSGLNVLLAEPAFSVENGYPGAIAFYQDRLWFASTKKAHSTIWVSATDKVFLFQAGTNDEVDPFSVKLSGQTSAKIKHLVSDKNLMVMTDVGEYTFLTAPDQAISPSNILIQRHSSDGCTDCLPQSLDNLLFYVQSGGNVIRSTSYSFDTNSYSSTNASILCPELIINPTDSAVIKNIDGDDNTFLIYINGDDIGSIACLQSVQAENISGWTKWQGNGFKFKSVCSLDSRAFALITDGTNTSLVEFSFKAYTDCQVTTKITNNAVDLATPLLHNKNLSLLAENKYSQDSISKGILFQLPSTTELTLTPPPPLEINDDNATLGITIISKLISIPYNLRDEHLGDLFFTKKKLTGVYVYAYNTLGLSLVTDIKNEVMTTRRWDKDKYDNAPEPKTFVFEFSIATNWDYLTQLTLVHAEPYPCSILAIGGKLSF